MLTVVKLENEQTGPELTLTNLTESTLANVAEDDVLILEKPASEVTFNDYFEQYLYFNSVMVLIKYTFRLMIKY